MAFDLSTATPVKQSSGGFDLSTAKLVDQEDEGFSPMGAVANVIPSAGQLVSDVTSPIHSPIKTGTGIYNILADVVNQAQGKETPVLDAMGKYYKERYSDIPKTLEEDPMGLLSDFAGVLTLGGSLAGKVPGIVGKAGNKISKAGSIIDPLNIPGIAASKVGEAVMKSPFMKNKPREMIKSAAKFSTVLDKKSPLSDPQMVRNSLADTMLKYNIMPTENGQLRAGKIIKELDADLENIIKFSDNAGVKLNTQPIVSAANRLMNKVARTSTSKPLLVKKEIDDFVKARGSLVDMTPSEMQSYKKELYNDVNWNKKTMAGSRVGNKTKKEMAKAAKEQIETLDPRIKPLNQEMGELLQLADPLSQSSARIANRDLIGIGLPIKAAAMESVIPGSGIAGLAHGLLDSPKIKSGIALKLNALKDAGEIDISTLNTLMKHFAVESGRQQED